MEIYDVIVLAQVSGNSEPNLLVSLLQLALSVLLLAGLWQVFVKMGEEGWKAIIPFYNVYILLEKVGRPTWWLLLFFIPLVNIVVAFLMWKDIAEGFGKGTGYAVGLLFLSFIFVPLLGFGDDSWRGAPA